MGSELRPGRSSECPRPVIKSPKPGLSFPTDWSSGRGLPAQSPRSLMFPGLDGFGAIARVGVGRPNPDGDGIDDQRKGYKPRPFRVAFWEVHCTTLRLMALRDVQ